MTFAEALGELGLETGASPDAIRAAYLKLLKVRKPDSDPEGFQRLREAYERAKAPAGEPMPEFVARSLDHAMGSPELRSAVRMELDRIGSDPLRALQRIRLLDAAFSRARDDEEVVLLLLEELLAADMQEGIPDVLSAHRPAKSARPWEWALRMLPSLDADRVASTTEQLAPEVLIDVAQALLTHRQAQFAARRLAVRGLRGLGGADVWRELDDAVDELPIALWLLACRAVIARDSAVLAQELSALSAAELSLLGETLRARAPRTFERLATQLPPAAALDVVGDPAEEPMVRYLRMQLEDVDRRHEALKELVRRRPADVELVQRLLRDLLVQGEVSEIAARLAAHVAATEFELSASPLWEWAVTHSAALMKLPDVSPQMSPLWARVVMCWALSASGHDADEAARRLWALIFSTPETALNESRSLLLVAVLETCARSMTPERARLLEWLWFFVREPELDFARRHPRQVVGRTMETALAGLRNAISETNFVRPATVALITDPVELLKLRDQVLVKNPTLAPQAAPSQWTPTSYTGVARVIYWALASIIVVVLAMVVLSMIIAAGQTAGLIVIAVGLYYAWKRSNAA